MGKVGPEQGALRTLLGLVLSTGSSGQHSCQANWAGLTYLAYHKGWAGGVVAASVNLTESISLDMDQLSVPLQPNWLLLSGHHLMRPIGNM